MHQLVAETTLEVEAAAAGTAVALEQQVVGQMVVEVDQDLYILLKLPM